MVRPPSNKIELKTPEIDPLLVNVEILPVVNLSGSPIVEPLIVPSFKKVPIFAPLSQRT